MKLFTSLILLSLAVTGAQAKPDFSGVWVQDMSLLQTTIKVDQKAKSMGLQPTPITITQTADTVRLQHAPPFPDWKGQLYVYNLAGKETKNYNGANIQTTKSRWDGNKLVIEGTSYSETSQGESTWKLVETIWLDAKGRLIIERRMTDERGKTDIVTQTHERKK